MSLRLLATTVLISEQGFYRNMTNSLWHVMHSIYMHVGSAFREVSWSYRIVNEYTYRHTVFDMCINLYLVILALLKLSHIDIRVSLNVSARYKNEIF
jgi:hypothetical protein